MANASLADALGVPDPRDNEPPDEPFDPATSAKAFARAVLTSRQYRESLMRRIVLNELPPAVELRLYDYAYGRPVERMRIDDTSASKDLRILTNDELKSRHEYLLSLARQLARESADPHPVCSANGETPTTFRPH